MAVYEFITVTGVIVVDTAQILAGIILEYQDLFGTDLNTDPSTPQGMLITAETAARVAVAENNAALANQLNPNLAGGQFLYAIGQLTNSPPQGVTYTAVPAVTLGGIPGTPIPAGSQAQSSVNSEIFQSLNNVTLDLTGAATVEFVAVNPGPIDAPIGSLTLIVQGGVDGWETVNNTLTGIPGQLAQTDFAYRTYRRETLALQGNSQSEAVISALRATPGVRGKPKYLENLSPDPAVIEGIYMVGHSIYACVDGGSDDDVANALTGKKSAGASYNGSTVVTQTDPLTGQIYTVKFDRPVIIGVLAQVTVVNSGNVANPIDVVIAAILAYADGQLDNDPGLAVAIPVSPFELAGAVNRAAPGLYVQLVQVAYAIAPVFQPITLAIATNQRASIDAGSIEVTVV